MKTVVKKRNDFGIVKGEMRGKRDKKDSPKQYVISHIKRFPVEDLHYCRKETAKRYLHKILNIRKMYDFYIIWCDDKEKDCCKLSYYRRILKIEFNLSFFVHKMDK